MARGIQHTFMLPIAGGKINQYNMARGIKQIASYQNKNNMAGDI